MDITSLGIELRESPVNLCSESVWKMSQEYTMECLSDRAPAECFEQFHTTAFTIAMQRSIQEQLTHQCAGIYTFNWGEGKGDVWFVLNNFGGFTVMLPDEYEGLEHETTL